MADTAIRDSLFENAIGHFICNQGHRPLAGERPAVIADSTLILHQWKQDFNFVSSYFVNVGDRPNSATDPLATDWAKSLPYYRAILAMNWHWLVDRIASDGRVYIMRDVANTQIPNVPQGAHKSAAHGVKDPVCGMTVDPRVFIIAPG
jgi:hypothetical protein